MAMDLKDVRTGRLKNKGGRTRIQWNKKTLLRSG